MRPRSVRTSVVALDKIKQPLTRQIRIETISTNVPKTFVLLQRDKAINYRATTGDGTFW